MSAYYDRLVTETKGRKAQIEREIQSVGTRILKLQQTEQRLTTHRTSLQSALADVDVAIANLEANPPA